MVEMMEQNEKWKILYKVAAIAALIAAGQTMMSTYTGTAFHVSYILGQIAGIIVSVVMLRSKFFSRVTGYAGILGNAIGFGLYLPVIGIYISLFSVIALWIWYILIARKLFMLRYVK